jgi:hypothetical protein
MAVAGMDAYFTDKFAEIFVPYIKKFGVERSPDLLDLLQKAEITIAITLGLLSDQRDRPLRTIRRHLDKYFNAYVTQKISVIDKLYACYNLKDLSKNAQNYSGKKELIKNVETIIQLRHEIAHAGHYNSHKKLKTINRTYVQNKINDLKAYINSVDYIISKKMNGK